MFLYFLYVILALMRKWLATLSVVIGLTGCHNAPDAQAVKTQASADSARASNVVDTAATKVNNVCNYNPSESAIIANREQKEFWIKTHPELHAALSRFKYVPYGKKSDSNGKKYDIWWKKDVQILRTVSWTKWSARVYYDVTIKLPNPVTVQGRQYNEVYLSVTPDASFGLTKFQNSWDTFPKLRFLHTGNKDSPDVLCLTSRYYDDVDGISLKDMVSVWIPVQFNQTDFNNLVNIALGKIKK